MRSQGPEGRRAVKATAWPLRTPLTSTVPLLEEEPGCPAPAPRVGSSSGAPLHPALFWLHREKGRLQS